MPHWTPASRAPSAPATPVTVLSWTAPVGDARPATLAVELPADRRDVSGRQHLELRLAPAEGLLAPVDLRVTAVDGAGRERSALVSELGDALTPLPAGVSPLLPKTVLRTVQVPVSRLDGLDTTDLREVRLTAATPTGTVYLSDLTASSPGAGRGGPSDLPQVSVSDAAVAEGDGTSTAVVAVRLSRPSAEDVRVRVESLAAAGPLAREAREVVLPPGATCVPFTVPLAGDELPGAAATTTYAVVAAVPVGAVTGDAFGVLTVHEDDGVVAADGAVTPVVDVPGPQPDVCAAA